MVSEQQPERPTLRDPDHDEIYGAILQVRTSVADLRDQVLDLKGHVNDERDQMMILINQKQDADSLLTSFGEKLLRNRVFRWAFGVVATATVGTAAAKHWSGPLYDLLVKIASAL